ncbi:MAG: methyltransferase domain-containing protein [Ilumatobacteraceae bacterium]
MTSDGTGDGATAELFEDPSEWRTRVVVDLGLDGEQRCAGASTSAAMPQLVDHLRDVLGSVAPGIGLDIGGGLGPLSAWLVQRTHHRVVPVDPSEASCRGARRLFGLASVRADASALPFATASCSMTLLNGVVSLLDDLGSAVAEAARTTRPDGIVAVADLTANGEHRVTSANNTFWVADDVVAALERAGCVVDYVACGNPDIGEWASVQQVVDDQIRRRYSDAPGYEQWRDDGARLTALIDAGTIGVTSIIARRTTTPDRTARTHPSKHEEPTR